MKLKGLLTVVRCAIWFHLYNLKNVKNTPPKINTPPWVFSLFLNCTKGTKSCNASQLCHDKKSSHYHLFSHAIIWTERFSRNFY